MLNKKIFGAVPDVVVLIVKSAFNPVAATGGFAGAAVWAAICFGVARGVFSNETGASLSVAAFESALPGVGGYIVTLGLALFAFTTLLGWSFYAEKCVEYLHQCYAFVVKILLSCLPCTT